MARRQLEDYTPDELAVLDYLDILTLRADAYRRHVRGTPARGDEPARAGMTVPPALGAWAERMTKRYGDTVRVWKNTVGWLEALMIVRYGEDPMQWPPAFTEDDVLRAEVWRVKGRTPKGIAYLDDDSLGVISLKLLGVLAILAGLAVAVFTLVGETAGRAFGLFIIGSALTNFWENELIDHLFRNRSYTAPTALFVALYTAAPGETGGGTEVSGGSYARVSYSQGTTNWEGTGGETTAVDSAGTGGGTQNINAITFATPSANWGTITHFACLDASSGGNMYFYGALTASKNVNNGDPAPSFPAGALDFALA